MEPLSVKTRKIKWILLHICLKYENEIKNVFNVKLCLFEKNYFKLITVTHKLLFINARLVTLTPKIKN